MRFITALFLALMINVLSGCYSATQYNAGANADNSTRPENKATPSPQNAEPIVEASNLARAVFAVFEENKLNLYSSNLDGSNRQLLISEETEMTGARMFTAIRAEVSPAGNAITGRFTHTSGYPSVFLIDGSDENTLKTIDKTADFHWSPDGERLLYTGLTPSGDSAVFVVDKHGENKQKILDKAANPHWSPDGKKILYVVPLPPKLNTQEYEMPLWADGGEWHLFNSENGVDDKLSVPEDKLQWLASWSKNDEILFFSETSQYQASHIIYLYALNLRTKQKRQIKLLEGDYQFNEVSTNPSNDRTMISLLPGPYGNINYSCDYYQLSSMGLGEHIIANRNYQCENTTWNTDDEFFYNKRTEPKVRIKTDETSKSGYNVLFSIYKYNFKTKRDDLVLKSGGKEIYRMQGVLKNQALVVSNESATRSPHYQLEVRDLKGKYQATLFSSENEMLFIGWL